MINTGSFCTDTVFQSAGYTAYILIFAFIIGTVFGSFINCLAYRLVHNESIVKGRSHCAVCGHTLSAADLVPVFSYIFLKGRCRYCHEKISPRYMLVELVTGAAFVICVLRWGISVDTLRWMAMSVILIGLSLVDMDSMEIPNGFVLASMAVFILTFPFVHEYWRSQLISAIVGSFGIAIGLLIISIIFDKVTGKEGLGGGDIKLFFIVGMYLGLMQGIFCLILSCIIGLIVSAVMKKGKREEFAFGPSISAAFFISAIFAQQIVGWYMGLLW